MATKKNWYKLLSKTRSKANGQTKGPIQGQLVGSVVERLKFGSHVNAAASLLDRHANTGNQ